MFKLKKINVTYQEDKILHDLSFQIQSGEFVYLTGKSGAGKSSLLRLLHGELSFSGDFIFREHDVQFEVPDYRRQFQKMVKYVSQQLMFDSSKTVVENLAIYDHFKRKAQNSVAENVAKWLSIFSLSHLREHYPDEISGGDQSRLALAMALTTQPRILLLDEPTANLDPKMSARVLTYLESLNAQGVTIILATHDASILEKFPHRCLELREGEIV
ncbi:MAG: cell division ATP-binding protein FtsE [Pseudolactococcus laudensis]|nr:ATP-binding cassette domain-containing protein [Lactococcus sp.]